MCSPILWYDRTPLGRITSRLSKDVSEADTTVSGALYAVRHQSRLNLQYCTFTRSSTDDYQGGCSVWDIRSYYVDL